MAKIKVALPEISWLLVHSMGHAEKQLDLTFPIMQRPPFLDLRFVMQAELTKTPLEPQKSLYMCFFF